MNKIDEIIESVRRHTTTSVMIEQLNDIRPYVELGELCFKMENYDINNPDYAELDDIYVRYNELIQKINELEK